MPYIEAEADTGTRQDHLFLLLENLLAEHTAWAESEDSELHPSDGFYKAVEETIEIFGDGDIPGKLREVERSIRDLATEWAEFIDRVDQTNDPKALPNSKFWKLVDTIRVQREVAAPSKRFRLETIAELVAQKVPNAQICKIYGWVDAGGRPEVWKLQEEISTPGTHVGPDFVPPHERKRLAQEARQKEIIRTIQARIDRRVKTANEPAHEPIETLARQGVFVRQIAKMKKMTVPEVLSELKGLGIEPPPMDAADSLARASQIEHPEGELGDARRRVDEATRRPLRRPEPVRETVPEQEFAEQESPADALGDEFAGAEILDEDDAGQGDALAMLDASDREAAELGEQLAGLTIEQEIVQLHEAAMPDKEIAKGLGIQVGKVRHTLKKWRENPSAFEA